jgi:CRP-like cAMP-binding protein
MAGFSVLTFSKNEIIFKEGSHGASAYIVKAGSVEISIDSGSQTSVLHVLQPVNIFGEMSLLMEGQKRTATARALEYCELIEVDRDAFSGYMQKSPDFIRLTLNSLVERMKKTTRMLSTAECGPDLQSGVREIMSLMAAHNTVIISYGKAAHSLSKAFQVEARQVEEEFSELEQMGFIKVDMDPRLGRVLRIVQRPGR